MAEGARWFFRVLWACIAGQLLACGARAPDPLAEPRELWRTSLAQPLAGDWPSQASLVFGSAQSAGLIKAQFGPVFAAQGRSQTEFMGTWVTATPRIRSGDVQVRGDPSCDQCLAVQFTLVGSHEIDLKSPSELDHFSLPWTAHISALFRVVLGQDHTEARVIDLELAGPQAWEGRVDSGPLPAKWEDAVGEVVRSRLLSQVVHPEAVPRVRLMRLAPDGPVGVRDVRVRRTKAGHVVLDLAFAVSQAGVVSAVPDPGDGWALVVPQRTAEGMLQSASLRAALVDVDVVGEVVGLRWTRERGLLNLLVWPLRPPKDFVSPPEVEIDLLPKVTEDGLIDLEPRSLRVVNGAAEAPDMNEVLYQRRFLREFGQSIGVAVPTPHMLPDRSAEHLVRVEDFRVHDGELAVMGRVELKR